MQQWNLIMQQWLLTKLSESNVSEQTQETIVRQSIDAPHFESCDQAPTKKEKKP